MAMNGLISRRRLSDGSIDGLDLSSSSDLQHKVHVLAVDDSPVDRKSIERLLKISACKVTAVDSGRRALQFLGLDDEERDSSVVDGLKVDLVITDYCMPGMTGYELLKKIKESSALRDTPVVIMSSENVDTRVDRCLEGGAEEFILKPVKLGDVRRLKDYMMLREDRLKDAMDVAVATGVVVGVHKRKSRDDGSEFSSQPPVPLQPPASPPSSPDSPLLLSPASSDSEIRPSTATSSPAESPSSTSGELDFPTRKIELTLRDDHEIVPDSKL